MAFDLVRRLRHLEIPHLPGIKFTLRIGCHSGKACIIRLAMKDRKGDNEDAEDFRAASADRKLFSLREKVLSQV